MAKREILLLGHENLYEISRSITEDQLKKAKKIINDLHDTIVAFKETYDYGRAIAAPQIDEAYRIIYMHLGDRQIHFINPVIEPLEASTFELWDDCMSFPGLEVLVRRYTKIKATYRDLDWKEHETFFEGDLSELFQHEYDHLDGILAVQRAINNKSFRINRDKAGKF